MNFQEQFARCNHLPPPPSCRPFSLSFVALARRRTPLSRTTLPPRASSVVRPPVSAKVANSETKLCESCILFLLHLNPSRHHTMQQNKKWHLQNLILLPLSLLLSLPPSANFLPTAWKLSSDFFRPSFVLLMPHGPQPILQKPLSIPSNALHKTGVRGMMFHIVVLSLHIRSCLLITT